MGLMLIIDYIQTGFMFYFFLLLSCLLFFCYIMPLFYYFCQVSSFFLVIMKQLCLFVLLVKEQCCALVLFYNFMFFFFTKCNDPIMKILMQGPPQNYSRRTQQLFEDLLNYTVINTVTPHQELF